MAATMERLQEYRTHNSQFCKRVFDYLTLRFTVQSKLLLGDSTGLTAPDVRGARPVPTSHQELEAYFDRYSGLMLYLKEMDESIYAKLCAVSRLEEMDSLLTTKGVFLGCQRASQHSDQIHACSISCLCQKGERRGVRSQYAFVS